MELACSTILLFMLLNELSTLLRFSSSPCFFVLFCFSEAISR